MDAAERKAWLLAGDPAVSWQVQRDLLDRGARTWKATRRKVEREGWGARLLVFRAPDGRWGGGLYSPKWTSTFYTLRLLAQLGLPPTNRDGVASCRLLLDEGVSASGGVSLWTTGWTDTCVTAMLVSMACHFGLGHDERTSRMVRWLLAEQMGDGGWNCDRHKGATHSSFHTTISTLEALAAYEGAVGASPANAEASASGREFFLQHQLYRSSRTGNVVKPAFTKLSFPPRWYFDVLRGLEYFRAVDAPLDPRLSDPIEVVRGRERNGRWTAQNRHTGKVHFRLEEPRQPSRMNTLRALRVLRWADR
jgi:hypothetical protein